MCGMNLAFNRDLIGPAMYFGLMGDGQPIGRYGNLVLTLGCALDKVLTILLMTAHVSHLETLDED